MPRVASCFVLSTFLALSGSTRLAAEPIAGAGAQLSDETRSYYLGVWRRVVSDDTGRTMITLELRGDGTYLKTLDAVLHGQSFHNTEGGSWSGQGPVVSCSGDGNAPPSRHDLRLYQKI